MRKRAGFGAMVERERFGKSEEMGGACIYRREERRWGWWKRLWGNGFDYNKSFTVDHLGYVAGGWLMGLVEE